MEEDLTNGESPMCQNYMRNIYVYSDIKTSKSLRDASLGTTSLLMIFSCANTVLRGVLHTYHLLDKNRGPEGEVAACGTARGCGVNGVSLRSCNAIEMHS